MSSLRTKRIEILQELQGTKIERICSKVSELWKIVNVVLGKIFSALFLGGSDSPPITRNCDENLTTAPILPLSSLALPDHTVKPSNPATTSSILSPSPASSPPVFIIKRERLSPVNVSPTQEPTDNPLSGPHSTTPEQSAAATEIGVEPVSLGKVSCSLNQKISLLFVC